MGRMAAVTRPIGIFSDLGEKHGETRTRIAGVLEQIFLKDANFLC
jgi:hypothetical protein